VLNALVVAKTEAPRRAQADDRTSVPRGAAAGWTRTVWMAIQ
jgi:hypothetical protein